MRFFCWLVDTGFCKRIEAHCMPVGHTKFSPDLFFGHAKKKFRVEEISIPAYLCDVFSTVPNSTVGMTNVTDRIVLTKSFHL